MTLKTLVATFTLFVFLLGAGSRAFAEEEKLPTLPDQFSPNPLLEILKADPLLQELSITESLTDKQRQALSLALDQLATNAQGLLQSGNIIGAFELLNRELQLRRYLGITAEIQALARVGKIAKDHGQPLQLKWITERLQGLQQEILSQSTLNLEQLQALALALQEVHAKNPALEVYQQILTEVRKRQDKLAEEMTLKAIGELYINWLDYRNAATIYEELLTLQQENHPFNSAAIPISPPSGNSAANFPQVNSLKQLVYLYSQSRKPLESIAAKERLIDFYLNQKNLAAVPELKLAIATDYETLGQVSLAGQYYQEAYSLALPIEQFAVANDALEKLAMLYRSQNQMEAALQIYQTQLAVAQRGYNVYGMMNAYDQIGQVFLELKAYPQALSAFQQAQELTQQLGGYRYEDFAAKIDRINRRIYR